MEGEDSLLYGDFNELLYDRSKWQDDDLEEEDEENAQRSSIPLSLYSAFGLQIPKVEEDSPGDFSPKQTQNLSSAPSNLEKLFEKLKFQNEPKPPAFKNCNWRTFREGEWRPFNISQRLQTVLPLFPNASRPGLAYASRTKVRDNRTGAPTSVLRVVKLQKFSSGLTPKTREPWEKDIRPLLWFLDQTCRQAQVESKIWGYFCSDDLDPSWPIVVLFNTGLVKSTSQEPLWAVLTQAFHKPDEEQHAFFRLVEFATRAELENASVMKASFLIKPVSTIPPASPHFFLDPSDLVFDKRLPIDPSIQCLVDKEREKQDFPQVKEALVISEEKVKSNIRLAVPCFYKEKHSQDKVSGKVCLLIPGSLSGRTGPVTFAFCIRKVDDFKGEENCLPKYQVESLLSLSQAFHYARLICKVDQDWLLESPEVISTFFSGQNSNSEETSSRPSLSDYFPDAKTAPLQDVFRLAQQQQQQPQPSILPAQMPIPLSSFEVHPPASNSTFETAPVQQSTDYLQNNLLAAAASLLSPFTSAADQSTSFPNSRSATPSFSLSNASSPLPNLSQLLSQSSQQPASSSGRLSGRIKLWKKKEGYGYIIPDQPNPDPAWPVDIFIHASEIRGAGYEYIDLRRGQPVEYQLRPQSQLKGRQYEAFDVTGPLEASLVNRLPSGLSPSPIPQRNMSSPIPSLPQQLYQQLLQQQRAASPFLPSQQQQLPVQPLQPRSMTPNQLGLQIPQSLHQHLTSNINNRVSVEFDSSSRPGSSLGQFSTSLLATNSNNFNNNSLVDDEQDLLAYLQQHQQQNFQLRQ